MYTFHLHKLFLSQLGSVKRSLLYIVHNTLCTAQCRDVFLLCVTLQRSYFISLTFFPVILLRPLLAVTLHDDAHTCPPFTHTFFFSPCPLKQNEQLRITYTCDTPSTPLIMFNDRNAFSTSVF